MKETNQDPKEQSPQFVPTQQPGSARRGQWSSHLDYLMALVGYCVGFGNLWRFPYICVRNGGGAFLIPFFFFLCVGVFPMFAMEAALSQFSGKGAIHMWSFCPLFRGVGLCCLVQAVLYYPYYTILISWPIYYMIKSCSAVLPWTTCGNWWNTELCVEDVAMMVKHKNITGTYLGDGNFAMMDRGLNVTNSVARNLTKLKSVISDDLQDTGVIDKWRNDTFSHSAVEEFWQYNVLGISSGLEEVGTIQWHLVGCLAASYVIIVLCLSRGVKSVGKVVYVTALLPYILLLAIFIKTLHLPGAVGGILYFLTPDFSKLLHTQVWLEACVQVSYTLGVGYGIIGTCSSYNKFNEPCIRDSITVCLISEGTSIFAGFVTFSVLGVMATNIGVPISEVVSSGPGITFIAYPEALSKLPLPQVWSFVFFFMLLSIGLDSQFMATEIVTTAIIDQYPSIFKRRRCLLTFSICLVSFIIGILYCTQGGQYIFQLMDWYVCAFGFFVVCIGESVCVAWIYGIRQFSKDMTMMLGRPPPLLLRLIWCYLSPAIYLVAFVMTLSMYEPPTYGSYKYPAYVNYLGWFIASLSIIPVPIFIVRELRKHKGVTFMQRVSLSLQPDLEWRPREPEYQEEHKTFLKNRPSIRDKFRDSFSLRV